MKRLKKPPKTSFMIASSAEEVRTGCLQVASVKCYNYTNLLDSLVDCNDAVSITDLQRVQ
jgi:hypothetical protein